MGTKTRVTVVHVIGIESARPEAIAFLFGDFQGTLCRIALRIPVKQSQRAILASWLCPPIFRPNNFNLLSLTFDFE